MSALLENIRSLRNIREQLDSLAARKSELEREARQTSIQTQSRACRIVSEATLALLARGTEIDIDALTQELERLAHDRFAVAQAQDWLAEAKEAAETQLS